MKPLLVTLLVGPMLIGLMLFGCAEPSAVPALPADTPASGQAEPVESAAEPAASGESPILAVLRGEAEFFSVDAGRTLTLDTLAPAAGLGDGVTAEAGPFSVADLDADGQPEAVLSLLVNGDSSFGFLVLQACGEAAYGYFVPYRALMELKADGTASFSSGAADSGFGTLRFADDGVTTEAAAYSESGFDADQNMSVTYYIDGAPATEEAFAAAVVRQAEKPAAVWFEPTPENASAALAQNG